MEDRHRRPDERNYGSYSKRGGSSHSYRGRGAHTNDPASAEVYDGVDDFSDDGGRPSDRGDVHLHHSNGRDYSGPPSRQSGTTSSSRAPSRRHSPPASDRGGRRGSGHYHGRNRDGGKPKYYRQRNSGSEDEGFHQPDHDSDEESDDGKVLVEGELQLSDGEANSASKPCPICLQPFDDRSVLTSCFHEFCHFCIRKWADISRACPLCKKGFKECLHDFRSDRDYIRYKFPIVPVEKGSNRLVIQPTRMLPELSTLPSDPNAPPPTTEQILADAKDRIRGESKEERRKRIWFDGKPTMRDFKAMSPIDKRRYKLEPQNPPTNNRQVTPQMFQKDKQLQDRVRPWITRDLQVLLKDSDVEIIQELVVSVMERFALSSKEAVDELRPYVPKNTEQFLKELEVFAQSTLNMKQWDKLVRYSNPNAAKEGGGGPAAGSSAATEASTSSKKDEVEPVDGADHSRDSRSDHREADNGQGEDERRHEIRDGKRRQDDRESGRDKKHKKAEEDGSDSEDEDRDRHRRKRHRSEGKRKRRKHRRRSRSDSDDSSAADDASPDRRRSRSASPESESDSGGSGDDDKRRRRSKKSKKKSSKKRSREPRHHDRDHDSRRRRRDDDASDDDALSGSGSAASSNGESGRHKRRRKESSKSEKRRGSGGGDKHHRRDGHRVKEKTSPSEHKSGRRSRRSSASPKPERTRSRKGEVHHAALSAIDISIPQAGIQAAGGLESAEASSAAVASADPQDEPKERSSVDDRQFLDRTHEDQRIPRGFRHDDLHRQSDDGGWHGRQFSSHDRLSTTDGQQYGPSRAEGPSDRQARRDQDQRRRRYERDEGRDDERYQRSKYDGRRSSRRQQENERNKHYDSFPERNRRDDVEATEDKDVADAAAGGRRDNDASADQPFRQPWDDYDRRSADRRTDREFFPQPREHQDWQRHDSQRRHHEFQPERALREWRYGKNLRSDREFYSERNEYHGWRNEDRRMDLNFSQHAARADRQTPERDVNPARRIRRPASVLEDGEVEESPLPSSQRFQETDDNYNDPEPSQSETKHHTEVPITEDDGSNAIIIDSDSPRRPVNDDEDIIDLTIPPSPQPNPLGRSPYRSGTPLVTVTRATARRTEPSSSETEGDSKHLKAPVMVSPIPSPKMHPSRLIMLTSGYAGSQSHASTFEDWRGNASRFDGNDGPSGSREQTPRKDIKSLLQQKLAKVAVEASTPPAKDGAGTAAAKPIETKGQEATPGGRRLSLIQSKLQKLHDVVESRPSETETSPAIRDLPSNTSNEPPQLPETGLNAPPSSGPVEPSAPSAPAQVSPASGPVEASTPSVPTQVPEAPSIPLREEREELPEVDWGDDAFPGDDDGANVRGAGTGSAGGSSMRLSLLKKKLATVVDSEASSSTTKPATKPVATSVKPPASKTPSRTELLQMLGAKLGQLESTLARTADSLAQRSAKGKSMPVMAASSAAPIPRGGRWQTANLQGGRRSRNLSLALGPGAAPAPVPPPPLNHEPSETGRKRRGHGWRKSREEEESDEYESSDDEDDKRRHLLLDAEPHGTSVVDVPVLGEQSGLAVADDAVAAETQQESTDDAQGRTAPGTEDVVSSPHEEVWTPAETARESLPDDVKPPYSSFSSSVHESQPPRPELAVVTAGGASTSVPESDKLKSAASKPLVDDDYSIGFEFLSEDEDEDGGFVTAREESMPDLWARRGSSAGVGVVGEGARVEEEEAREAVGESEVAAGVSDIVPDPVGKISTAAPPVETGVAGAAETVVAETAAEVTAAGTTAAASRPSTSRIPVRARREGGRSGLSVSAMAGAANERGETPSSGASTGSLPSAGSDGSEGRMAKRMLGSLGLLKK
ncbi:hypothetical protein HDU96_006101 [Phlyctochytrium bullatum]|nr:hypothetical protein HDU96_006101 [Phlyctochytrium bullatum]